MQSYIFDFSTTLDKDLDLRFRQKKMFNLEREPCWAWVVVILREVGVKKFVYANGSISGKFEQNIARNERD